MPFFIAQLSFSSRAVRVGVAAAIFLLIGLTAPLLKADDADLHTLRASFRHDSLSTILPEKRAYAAQLLALEKKLSTARDYADAIKVRDERLALEREIAVFELELPALGIRASGKSALLPERIVFSPQDATLAGVKLDKEGALTGWETAGSVATWKLPHLPEGGYEVMVKYICGESGSVTFEVREKFYMLRSKVTEPAGKQNEKGLGTLRIRDGDGTLTLAADGAGQSAQLRVVSLELIPVTR
ncbi:MAG: hypothetical protein K8R87_08595 [Verrucomicrobia bacterium]|nr:hypothetical protein [Verrucomicrobiota bacterium]